MAEVRNPYISIGTIPRELYDLIKIGECVPKKVKEYLDIPVSENYEASDSIINIECKTKPMDVFTAEYEGKTFYYIVTAPVDEERALSMDLYPAQHIL